nr:LysM peptidoglycan-binding domain-containing protein [Anaerolineae bacterium]
MKSIPRAAILLSVLVGVFLFSPSSCVFAQGEDPAAPVLHTVAWGETLLQIAGRYGVSSESIIAANHLVDGNRIFVGQVLIIPVGGDWQATTGRRVDYHVVQQGDTLYRIALAYGLRMADLVAFNNLSDENAIYVGQRLALSGEAAVSDGAELPGYHLVQSGESLSTISRQYGVSLSDLIELNRLFNPGLIYAGQRLLIPGAPNSSSPGYTPSVSGRTHVVQRGETLTAIASRYGTSVWTLAQVNTIANPSLLYIGQTIMIPEGSDVSPSSSYGAQSQKSIIVDISDQRTYVYENDSLLWTFVVSTGIPGRDTWRGNFQIQNKIPMAYASTWDLQMPYWLGFYWAGSLQNGFHALPILSNGTRLWAGLLGQPASYGCVILSEYDAQLLYNWAEIGTPVTVRN